MSTTAVRPEVLERIKAEGRRPVIASLGGGLDSWSMLLKATDKGEKPDVVCFVDVGNCDDRTVPAEWPGTYEYIKKYMVPFAEANGIQWVTLTHHDYPVRDAASLFEWMHARKQIPVSGPSRICTTVAKVERFQRWLDDNFAGQTCEVWLGFGAEPKEQKRADRGDPYSKPTKPGPNKANRVNRYPLIEWNVCRCQSAEIVKEHGFPVPQGSACVFCPYGQMTDFQTFATAYPELFERVCELEEQKPKTENGYQLTIKGWSKRKLKDGTVKVTEPWLRDWVKGNAAPRREACPVCGAEEALRKTITCGWTEDE